MELLPGDHLSGRGADRRDCGFAVCVGDTSMNEKITVLMSPNEKKSSRATGLARAIAEDNRFSLPDFQDIKTDLQFLYESNIGLRVFNAELKEPSDYVSTVLGANGHGAMQYLDMAEAGHRCMFLVLGSDADVSQAIKDSLKTRYRGSELAFQIASYEKRLIHFESLCEELKAPVERWKAMPYTRLLSRVHTILTGKTSMAGYGPRPKENEREVFAANCLFRGIGAETLAGVLKDYRVALVPRVAGARPVEELPGIGPKRACLLNERIVMVYGAGL